MSSLLSRFLQDAGEALGFNMKDDGGEDLVEDYSEEDKGGSSSSGGGISIAVSQGVQGSCTWIRIGAAGKGGKAKGSHKVKDKMMQGEVRGHRVFRNEEE